MTKNPSLQKVGPQTSERAVYRSLSTRLPGLLGQHEPSSTRQRDADEGRAVSVPVDYRLVILPRAAGGLFINISRHLLGNSIEEMFLPLGSLHFCFQLESVLFSCPGSFSISPARLALLQDSRGYRQARPQQLPESDEVCCALDGGGRSKMRNIRQFLSLH